MHAYSFVQPPFEEAPYRVSHNFQSFQEFPAGSRFFVIRDELQEGLQKLFDVAQESSRAQIPSKPLKFNDWVVQRYQPTHLGISPHRDMSTCVNIIALLVLEGKGRFGICANREGADIRPIRNEPGDLLLMRGPGFLGAHIRPFHFVDQIEVRRSSFALRHDESLI